jgi:ferrous iron transport protein A
MPLTARSPVSDATHASPQTLDTVAIGCSARLLAVGGEGDLRRRLLEMGFCGPVTIEVVNRAPFNDPIEFRVRGYYVSLRAEHARQIRVIPLA